MMGLSPALGAVLVHVIKNGHDSKHPDKQDYLCKKCNCHFDDLAGTIFAGHHQPLEVWMSCGFLMALNVSNRQIAMELDLSTSDVQNMTSLLRETVAQKYQSPKLSGKVEFDEVYVIAGHKGYPGAVDDSGRESRCRRVNYPPLK